jgi:DNA-binding CsgD family transcriptional regulator
VTNVISTPVWVVEVTFVATRRLAPDSYPAAVDVRCLFATPATNKEIAEEVFLSVDAVKAHLRSLFERFGLENLPQNQKRARLAATALLQGIVTARD